MPSAGSDLKAILRYRTFTGIMDRFMFVDSLKSLVRSADKPVIIITDGHPAIGQNIHKNTWHKS